VSTTVGIGLGFQEGLRLHPPEVVEVIARISSLPYPSAHCLASWAIERRWHMPVPGIAVSPRFPGVNCWVARQETDSAIALGALKKRPVRSFVVNSACDLHPSLAAMLSTELHLDPHVGAWCEDWDGRVCLLVPRPPLVQTLAGSRRAAAAHCGPRARLRVVLELVREASWSIISHIDSHLILAQRARYPAMAGYAHSEGCQSHSNLPHLCKLITELRELDSNTLVEVLS